jgi:hypothetical protein
MKFSRFEGYRIGIDNNKIVCDKTGWKKNT